VVARFEGSRATCKWTWRNPSIEAHQAYYANWGCVLTWIENWEIRTNGTRGFSAI